MLGGVGVGSGLVVSFRWACGRGWGVGRSGSVSVGFNESRIEVDLGLL